MNPTKKIIRLFFKVFFIFLILNTPLFAQEISQNKNETIGISEDEEKIKIRIIPDVLYEGIEIQNKSDKEIVNAKIKRIDKVKTDKAQIISDPLLEEQRQKQLDNLKNQLIESKN